MGICDWALQAAGSMMTMTLGMASLKTQRQFADSALFCCCMGALWA